MVFCQVIPNRLIGTNFALEEVEVQRDSATGARSCMQKMTSGFTFVKCDCVINACNHYPILVLMQIEHPSAWAWVVYGLQHFPFPPFIGLHPCCPVHNIHGLFTLGFTMQERYIYRIPYSYHGQLFAVAQAISWFRVSRVSKHCYIFFLSCINFSNNNNTHLHFSPALASLFLLKAAFMVYS